MTSLCGEFPGEVLEVDGTYVGDISGTSVLYFAQGEDIRQAQYPCGGVQWIFGTRWTSPWQIQDCFCLGGESGQHVPISVFGSYLGCLALTNAVDTSGPPGLETMYALTCQGSGYPTGNFTFWPNTWDYWHPAVGTQWVWQGWVKPYNYSIIGDSIRVGWGTVDWGYSMANAGTFDGASSVLDGAVNLPDATIDLIDASGFDTAGTVFIGDDADPHQEQVAYTGISGNTLTGCTGGARTWPSGVLVYQGQWTFFQMTRTIIAPWGNVVAEGPQLPVFGWNGAGFDREEDRLVDVEHCYCGPPPDYPDPEHWHCTENYQHFVKRAPWGRLAWKCLHVYPVVAPPEPAEGVFLLTEPNSLPFRDPHVSLDTLT